MKQPNTAERIIRALRSGPLYEGALQLIVGGENFYSELYGLQTHGTVERVPGQPQTWRLAQ